MKRLAAVILLSLSSFSFACDSEMEVDSQEAVSGDGQIDGEKEENSGSGGCGSSAESASSDLAAPSSAASDGSGASGTGTGSATSALQPGTLTSGVWDDNRNFDLFLGYRTKVGSGASLSFTEDEHRAAAAAFAKPAPKSTLDVSLVIDTTGSMGDEIAYLQREFVALANTIQSKYPDAAQRWSLVLYKDTTDDYVVRWFDFRADTNEFKAKLSEASAGGGGDFPEAPDQALSIAHRLSWRADASTAKLLFWVADAPHHAENGGRLSGAVRSARDKGIHIYPVASSGIDEPTELSMRSAAQLTGGRYLFLTDDSGVGNAHKEARVPCYFVTKLDSAILRMVDVELTGTYREPSKSEILRAGGDPQNGACQIAEQTVNIF
jgi:von Willebrand factor type A domain-containing protein